MTVVVLNYVTLPYVTLCYIALNEHCKRTAEWTYNMFMSKHIMQCCATFNLEKKKDGAECEYDAYVMLC